MPRFPTSPEYYSKITIPSDTSFGSHRNSISSAKFGIWIDSGNTELANWIKDFDWQSNTILKPDFSVFGGTVEFKSVPSYSDSFATCVFMKNFDTRVWCAYAGHYNGTDWEETSTFTFDVNF